MSISTYSELKTAVSNWLHRADLTSYTADFIQQGEAWLNRKLRTVDMEERSTGLTMGTTDRYDTLPARFLEMQSIFYTGGNNNYSIVYVEPSALIPLITSSGKPNYFTIKDGLEWSSVPDSAYDYEIHYFKALDIATDTTNWLLTNHPDIYLYAALSSASLYIKDDNRIAGLKALLQEAVDDLNTQDARKRGSQMIEMRTEIDSIGFNIIT